MLKPWREIITPHKDVAGGKYQQAEFAADLAQVLSGKAEPEYQDAFEFFSRTYLTEGMRLLLASSLRRATGINGEPVIQLKTAFGGGKTHTMLALYHLFNNRKIAQTAAVKEVLKFAQVKDIPQAKVAVLVGSALDASKPLDVQGIGKINTLWGFMAYQLGSSEGYSLVKTADQKGVAPGANTLVELFDKFGPCVVLIDELVAYCRNVYARSDLPGGSFESLMTFIQNITEAAKRSKNSMVIASIPESHIEIGGEGGSAALARIENTFGRLEAIWKPVKASESFEIVRRRLFEPVQDTQARDEVCRAFSKMYSKETDEFPSECRDGGYAERLVEAYPIHPEIFDRLYTDWSTLEKFQRTRGVLRLMAATIHELWVSGDRSLLIMPGTLPLDSPKVRDELTRYLPDEWSGLVDSDIDGERSEPKKLDEKNSRFGESSAARRVARAIFLGSAPSSKEQRNRGVEDLRIMLGVVQPEENIPIFRDALSRLTQSLTYLYYQGKRYWYDTHPNLRKTVEDRATSLDKEEVYSEIIRRLQAFRTSEDFAGIHICPESEDVQDEAEARLVVLSPNYPHRKETPLSEALNQAKEMLENRGKIPRQYRNMLVFVAADIDSKELLYEEVRRYLAWKSVVGDQDALNLDAHQRRQAQEQLDSANKIVDIRVNETYCWLLVPTQEGTSPVKIEAQRITKGEGTFVSKASKQARAQESLITRWSPTLLKNGLDKWLWKDKPHLMLKDLWNYFASYPYLPRLKDSSVLSSCIEDGLRSKDFFGYALDVDKAGKYLGIEIGSAGVKVLIDSTTLLVKRDIALRQVQESQPQVEGSIVPSEPFSRFAPTERPSTDASSKGGTLKRFYGAVEINPTRLARDVGQISEEVLQHLAALPSADVKVILEICAEVPSGIPEKVVRIVTENSKTLKFSASGFDET